MIVIPPVPLTATNTTSTVPEPSAGEVVWVSNQAYTKGAVVIRTQTHRRYEAISDVTSTVAPEADPIRWLDIGPTNKFAMFDNLRSMATTAAGSMTITITPNRRIDSLALMGLQAQNVKVWMTVGGSTVWGPFNRNMSGRNTTTWSQYFFGEFKYLPTLLFQDLPPYSAGTIHIEITTDPALKVACSEVIVGSKTYLGAAQYDAVSDSLNFSKIERDEFGNSLLRQRRTVPKARVTTLVNKGNVNRIREARTDLNAVPALWSALDDNYEDPYFESLFIYGIYKQFEIDISHPSMATVNLELEEM